MCFEDATGSSSLNPGPLKISRMHSHVEQVAVFFVMSILVALFAWIYVRDRQPRIAWWMFGWTAVLVHFTSQVLWSYSLITATWAVFLKTSMLLIAGMSFHLSVSEVFSASRMRAAYLSLVGLPALLYLTLEMWAPGVPVVFPLLLVISLSAVVLSSMRHHGRGIFFYSVLAPVALYSAWALWQSATGNIEAGRIFFLSIFFMVAAMLYYRRFHRVSPGVVTTMVSLFAWGMTFPLEHIFYRGSADPTVENTFLGLPPYFVAFGMILTLFENQTERANSVAEQFQVLFEGNLAGVYLCTLNGDIVDCNAAFLSLHGHTDKREMMKQRMEKLYVDPREWRLLRDRVIDYGRVLNAECRQVRKDGSLHWTLERISGLRGPDGATLLEGNVIDITERKNSEIALRQSEERFATIFRHSPVGCAIMTPECVFLNVNENLLNLLKLPAEQVIGKSAVDIGLLRSEAERERLFSDLRLRGPVKDREIDFLDSAGSKRFAVCFANLVRIGERECIFAMVLNRTEERELEVKFLQAQKMESLGRLAGGVAHDFNNLLGVIGGYAELLEARLGRENPHIRYSRRILEATERAGGLTRQLLTFSRREITRPSPLRPHRAIEELGGILARLIGEDIITQFDLRSTGTTLIDRTQFEQVILNVVVNARDAMPYGGHLTISTEDAFLPVLLPSGGVGSRRYVSIRFADTGTGMEEAVKQRALEPFFTTKSMGRGTGLGLSTVYGIVQQCGGEINIESEPGRGTCIVIMLPTEDSAEAETVPVPLPELPRGDGRILLVEDEPELINATSEYLESLGYSVTCASDGAAGLEKAETMERIDLVLCDVIMPRMNGREFAARLTALRPGVRFLFVSGYPDDVLLRTGVTRLGTPFLQKPYTLQELGRLVQELLTANSPKAAD